MFGFYHFIDIDCGELPDFEHGAIILSERRTSYGVQATYTCHENYTLIGNENRTCEMNGWSGKQPQCLVDWCPDPVPIAGGQVQLSGKRAGSTAVYECDPGYVLIGEPVIKYSSNYINQQMRIHFIFHFRFYLVA